MTEPQSFEEFWPYYVGEHSKPITRNLHFFGTHLGLLNLVAAIAFLQPLYILSGLVCGYGFAWIGHFFLEKNRPATFTYPRVVVPRRLQDARPHVAREDERGSRPPRAPQRRAHARRPARRFVLTLSERSESKG